MSINNVTIVGRLTRDPELRYSQSGTPVARFTVAVNRTRKVEGQPEADFISCIAFSKTAENLANHMRKGSQIGVIGRIQTGSYEKEGQKIYTTDIVADNIQFLEPRSDNNQSQQTNQSQSYQQPPQQQQQPQYQAPSQQQQPQYQQQTQQTYQPPQQNYGRVDEDPFKNNGRQLIVDEDSLPF